MYKKVTLKEKSGRQLKQGGLWIYDNEIAKIEDGINDGDIIRIEDFDGYPLGIGFINRKSTIQIRVLTRKSDVEINREFIYKRVKNAWEYRKKVMQKFALKREWNVIRVS